MLGIAISESNKKEVSDMKEPTQDDCITQDGCRGPRKAPWPSSISIVTTLPFLVVFGLGFYILMNSSMLKLAVWLAVVVFSIVPGRYFLCARCPYYGQDCSTKFGRLVPYLFRKQEEKSMRPGLWLDLTEMIVLFLIPLPDAWRTGGLILLLLWIGANLLSFGTLTRIACPACSFTFCPIGKAGRAIWKKSNTRNV